MNGSEDGHTHLTVNVNQSHVRNAVRDIVNQLLLPADAIKSFNEHVDKKRQQIDTHVDNVISKIVVPKELVDRRVFNLLERDLQRMVKEIVANEVQKIVRDEVSLAIRHIVQTGVTVEIGTGWKPTVQIKTEEKPQGSNSSL